MTKLFLVASLLRFSKSPSRFLVPLAFQTRLLLIHPTLLHPRYDRQELWTATTLVLLFVLMSKKVWSCREKGKEEGCLRRRVAWQQLPAFVIVIFHQHADRMLRVHQQSWFTVMKETEFSFTAKKPPKTCYSILDGRTGRSHSGGPTCWETQAG